MPSTILYLFVGPELCKSVVSTCDAAVLMASRSSFVFTFNFYFCILCFDGAATNVQKIVKSHLKSGGLLWP